VRPLSSTREEFDLWLSSKYSNPFWIGHHRFEKSITGEIRVDNGVFNREEAIILTECYGHATLSLDSMPTS
jgi:hypothetical protein